MKIEYTDSWLLRVPFTPTNTDVVGAQNQIIGLTIHAEGLTGTGFAFVTNDVAGRAVKVLLDDLLLPQIQNRSVFDLERIWQDLNLLTHRMGTGINRFAIACIDIALWDLRAKAHSVPLAAEIGQLATSVPAYGSGKASPRLDVNELVELSLGFVQDGFDAVKLRVGMNPDQDESRVKAVRDALGPDVRLMIDANERFDAPTALWLGRKVAKYDIYWFEEPVFSTDLESHIQLAQQLPITITGGEHHCSADEFRPFVRDRAFGILQPNPCMVGGVTEMMRIARMAEAAGLGFAPHLISELNIHIAAATSSTTYVEYFPYLTPFLTDELNVSDGKIDVPTKPGHGIEFAPDAIEKYLVE